MKTDRKILVLSRTKMSRTVFQFTDRLVKRWFVRLAFLFLAIILAQASYAQTLAFPGAEGFGARSVGGRGGKVIKVTNLNDDGPGSFRAACETSGPRIVVFATGGTIMLQSEIVIGSPFLTVAGQTAPGGGICIGGRAFRIKTHDVILRGIRFRLGDKYADRVNKQANLKFEPLHLLGRSGHPVHNIIIDHCSISWGIDKNIGIWGKDTEFGSGLYDITVQWCISSEALYSPLHPKGDHHAMGMFFSATRNASAHHNLIAHCNARNPQFAKFAEGEAINNVIYNWGSFATEIEGGAKVNLLGNYYKPGKNWERKIKGITLGRTAEKYGANAIYVKGNIGPGREADDQDEWNIVNGEATNRSSEPIVPLSGVKMQPAGEAYTLVLSNAGAFPRDPVDQRILSDVKNGTGQGIVSQEDVGGWPELSAGTPPPDKDEDGMPDEWETAHGLDPGNAKDATEDRDGDGYTNIEEYINSLIVWN